MDKQHTNDTLPNYEPLPRPGQSSGRHKMIRQVAVGAIALGLVGIGFGIAGTQGQDRGSSSAVGAVPEAAVCLDVNGSTSHVSDAMAHMNNAASAATSMDPAEAAFQAHETAVDIRLAADDVAAEPAVSGPLYSAADHYDAAGDYLDNMSGPYDVAAVEASASEIEAATSDIQTSTAAVKVTTTPAC